jgi:hypothetical protein
MKTIELSKKNPKEHKFLKEESDPNNSPWLNLARGKGSHSSFLKNENR